MTPEEAEVALRSMRPEEIHPDLESLTEFRIPPRPYWMMVSRPIFRDGERIHKGLSLEWLAQSQDAEHMKDRMARCWESERDHLLSKEGAKP